MIKRRQKKSIQKEIVAVPERKNELFMSMINIMKNYRNWDHSFFFVNPFCQKTACLGWRGAVAF